MWDAENMFSNDQPLAAGASDNIIDTGAADAGKGKPLYLQVNVSGGTSGALTVTLNASASPDMSGVRKVADYQIQAGKVARGGVVLAAPLPTGCLRYLRLAYAGASGGTVTAGLTLGAETSQM